MATAAQEAIQLVLTLAEQWQATSSSDVEPCRRCPVCRALALAESVGPEVVEQLWQAAEAFAATLGDLVQDIRQTDRAADPGQSAPQPSPH